MDAIISKMSSKNRKMKIIEHKCSTSKNLYVVTWVRGGSNRTNPPSLPPEFNKKIIPTWEREREKKKERKRERERERAAQVKVFTQSIGRKNEK